MKKSIVRIVSGATLALVVVAVTGGIASAAPAPLRPRPPIHPAPRSGCFLASISGRFSIPR
jgi:hypothetical protein